MVTNEKLVYLYQNGDKKALEELLEKNKGIVHKLSNKFYIEGINSIDREDLQQEGYIGLITAAERYDFNNENRAQFITYAVYWINQKISMYVKSRNTNDEISFNATTSENEDTDILDYIEGVDYSYENIDSQLYNLQLRKELEEAMSNFNTLREREILKLHYGWYSNKCMPLMEIGEMFKITDERARQIENKAMRKIRLSEWGRNKAKELYRQDECKYGASEEINRINFAQRYLDIEVI